MGPFSLVRFVRQVLKTSILFAFCCAAFAQMPEIFAITNKRTYTLEDLSPEIQQNWKELPRRLDELRLSLLDEMVFNSLLEMEAKARKSTVERLLQIEIDTKLPKPSNAEIRAVYEANKEAIGGKSLEEVKSQIVAFLTYEERKKLLEDFKERLKRKYKVEILADVRSSELKPSDVLVVIGNKKITFQEFKQSSDQRILNEKLYAFNQLIDALEERVFNDLIIEEAQARKIALNELIAQEVTNKMKEFSGEESDELMENLREKLFEKYGARFSWKGFEQFVQRISVDGSPSKGRLDAPVTVIMFSDFQCPACAATHPMLQEAIRPYEDKVRFVVKYFPLKIHKDAFVAAQAAHAAYLQGKFFEYVEILYNNQQALDVISLRKYASQLGLDLRKFDSDMKSSMTKEKIKRDIEEGMSHGVVATPTVFVNGVLVSYERFSPPRFRRIIKRALKNEFSSQQ